MDVDKSLEELIEEKGGGKAAGRPAKGGGARAERAAFTGGDPNLIAAIQADVLASGFADPVSRFEGDWEAEFVGGSGGGRQYQKRRPGGRLPPAGEAGFDSTCGVAPWDAVQD